MRPEIFPSNVVIPSISELAIILVTTSSVAVTLPKFRVTISIENGLIFVIGVGDTSVERAWSDWSMIFTVIGPTLKPPWAKSLNFWINKSLENSASSSASTRVISFRKISGSALVPSAKLDSTLFIGSSASPSKVRILVRSSSIPPFWNWISDCEVLSAISFNSLIEASSWVKLPSSFASPRIVKEILSVVSIELIADKSAANPKIEPPTDPPSPSSLVLACTAWANTATLE